MQVNGKEEVREMARKKSPTRNADSSSNIWENGETREKPDPASAGQSGDLQGLSHVPSANSESVTELLEEGQAFEPQRHSNARRLSKRCTDTYRGR